MEWQSLGLTSVVDPMVKDLVEHTGGTLAVMCVCPCGDGGCWRYDRVVLFGTRTVLPGAGCVLPRCKHRGHPAGYYHVGIYELGKGRPSLVMWRDDAHQHGRLYMADPQEVRDRWHRLQQDLEHTHNAQLAAG